MKLLKPLFFAAVVSISLQLSAQTSENPWAIAVGADLINLQGDNVDSGITSNITNLVMRRNLVPAYNTLANYELCYANWTKNHLSKRRSKSMGGNL